MTKNHKWDGVTPGTESEPAVERCVRCGIERRITYSVGPGVCHGQNRKTPPEVASEPTTELDG